MFYQYLRLVSYALVIIISAFSLPCKAQKDTRYLVLANLIVAIGSLLSVFHILFMGAEGEMARNVFVTPVAIIWAVLVFINFVKK